MIQSIANTIYCDRYNNVYPISVRQDWRKRDLLSWFHPYSWFNKLASSSGPFIVGFIVGVLLAVMFRRVLSVWTLVALQVVFMLIIKRPDYSTGSSIVSFFMDFLISIGMLIGFYCGHRFVQV